MSKGYRRVELKTDEEGRAPTRARRVRARKVRPLRIVLAVVGAALLVASGVQLVELMDAMPRPGASAATLTATVPSVAWTTVAGAVLLPLAAVLCFIAFSAVRTSTVRS